MTVESVLITGTTSGVGRALLELYAARGARIVSVNRRRDAQLEASYPQVRFECVDVRHAEDVDRLITSLSEAAQLPDAFILNAGINRIDNDESFDLAAYKDVIYTNLFGVLHFVAPLTRLAVDRKPRHIVAISSMASYVGNPYGLGYANSKRALTACWRVWSNMYAGTDLVFQRVMLGPVHTGIKTMHAQLPSWMVRVKLLFSASPAATARAVAGFAATRKSSLHYPWSSVPLYLAAWLCCWVVPRFFQGRRTLEGAARRALSPVEGRLSP